MNGNASSQTTVSAKTSESIIIRRARLTEGYALGRLAAKTYRNTPLSQYLSPNLDKYYSHYERGFTHRSQGRLLSPRNITVVACEASHPNRPIAYAAFVRLGDDEGAKRQIKSHWSVQLWALGWLFWVWVQLVNLISPDKSADVETLAYFEGKVRGEGKFHWDREDRKNRWHAQSVVVSEEFQGRGIGKSLMKEVIEWAESENVVVGLEASEPGEWMYRKMGFDLLARFKESVEGESGGGVMMYTPSSLERVQS